MFTDLPSLLNFYKLHYLDTTPLIRPAPKRVEKVQGKYDFDGSDPDDLPFKKGELLTVVSKVLLSPSSYSSSCLGAGCNGG